MFILIAWLIFPGLSVICIQAWTFDVCGKTASKRVVQISEDALKLKQFHAALGFLKMSPGSVMGFHAKATLQIRISQNFSNVERFRCSIMLAQDVPASFYVDQYELRRLGAPYVSWLFENNLDIELPEYQSRGSMLLQYLYLDGEKPRVELQVPWHARYHKCVESATITHLNRSIIAPTMYISCSQQPDSILYSSTLTKLFCQSRPGVVIAPCFKEQHSLCVWSPVIQIHDFLEVRIPVGQCGRGGFVARFTLLSASVATILVCYFLAK